MRVLVACEESQEVCKAFRAEGHEAFSADLQECSGGHSEWHISRKRLLEVFRCWKDVPDYNEAEQNIILAAIYETEYAPAVDAVEVVHGEWVESDYGPMAK